MAPGATVSGFCQQLSQLLAMSQNRTLRFSGVQIALTPAFCARNSRVEWQESLDWRFARNCGLGAVRRTDSSRMPAALPPGFA